MFFRYVGTILMRIQCHNAEDLLYAALAQYRGADKSLARPGRKQAWKHVRDMSGFNNSVTRAVIKFFFFPARQGAEGNSGHSDKH